ncbi:MAG: sigma-70 family RNA polymerase sigma factor [Cyclobacteriaceae bacterium]|nr:sigma-70 family RNA polymerase sigma factor [Cyclobacteriaceae bacterium]
MPERQINSMPTARSNSLIITNYQGSSPNLIDKLPAGRRTIFKLSREKGYTYTEIAELLHVSQGTVEKQMSKALKTLSSDLRSK